MFYLGTHIPAHFARSVVPLFVSRTRLERQKKWPRAQAPWSLDSGGFTEVALRGGWSLSPTRYAQMARKYRDEIGSLRWAAPQDWMCEPVALKATGLSVVEHQRRTIENYLDLVSYAPDVPWIPVLQGWEKDDYRRHVEMYAAAGVSLADAPIVGVGTVCRRQSHKEAGEILHTIRAAGVSRLHGFGFKVLGIRAWGHLLTSADSLAWSFDARYAKKRLSTCKHKAATCQNCFDYALWWRGNLIPSDFLMKGC